MLFQKQKKMDEETSEDFNRAKKEAKEAYNYVIGGLGEIKDIAISREEKENLKEAENIDYAGIENFMESQSPWGYIEISRPHLVNRSELIYPYIISNTYVYSNSSFGWHVMVGYDDIVFPLYAPAVIKETENFPWVSPKNLRGAVLSNWLMPGYPIS
ncbi:MAG: hypothetical protein B5M48_01315 [Candidatus Omnitrophica bacterium 4484_213]|nr:MAG: hypothetical protein B5M48_01315 [Candidatus Omnitrophica bacterium 4484_213]